MEVLWNFDGGIMESSWNFYGENPRLECGETAEKPRSICGESQMWNICVDLTHWKIVGWKIPKRAKMERYAKQTGKVEKCFGKLQTGQALKAARRF